MYSIMKLLRTDWLIKKDKRQNQILIVNQGLKNLIL